MTDAPERTWIKPFDECAGPHDWYVAITSGGVEYIRADLHQSALDRAAKADAEFVDMRLELLSALGEAGANLDRAVKAEAEVERLRAALLLIAEERGVCGACGMIATGIARGRWPWCDRNGGYNCNWQFQEPEKIARAALEDL